MRVFTTVRLRFRSFFRRGRVENDLQQELRDHLQREIEFHQARGLSAREAEELALRAFGNVALIEDQCRDTRRLNWIDDLRRDTAYALRSMRRMPAPVCVAVVSLALAIGANTAIFTLVNALLLRDLRVSNPHELVEVSRQTEYGHSYVSYPLFEQLRTTNTVFKDVVAVSAATITSQLESQPVGRFVSGNFFEVLGLSAARGRLLAHDDREPVAVITDSLWQRHYSRDPYVIGKTLPIDGIAFTIIGVLPTTFRGLVADHPDDFYIPLLTEPLLRRPSWLQRPAFNWLTVIGRLKSNVPFDAASANLNGIVDRYVTEFESQQRSHHIATESARAGVSEPRRKFAEPLWLLMGAVSTVLLIACANLTSLLLSRGVARRQEIAVRLALGASRGRLIRQLLTESVLLGVLGGMAGSVLAMVGTTAIIGLLMENDPTMGVDLRPDGRVLLFTVIASVGSALVAGVVPAFRMARPLASGRSLTASRGITRWNRITVTVQVALSLVLLVAASLLLTSLQNLRTSVVGFERERVLLIDVNPRKAGIEGDRMLAYYKEALNRVRRIAGVRVAALSLITPISGGGVDLSFNVAGRSRDPSSSVYVNRISDQYFTAMGVRMLLGRDFGSGEQSGAIVNRVLADRYFPNMNPIGQRARIGRTDGVEIIGVVANTKYLSLREDDQPIVYLPALTQLPSAAMTVVVSTADESTSLARIIRENLQALNAAVPISQGSTLSAHIDQSLINERLITRILGLLAIVALTLAAVGLYGMLAYAVTSRIPEIGVRLALGASSWSILSSIVREALVVVAVGAVAGLSVSLLVAQVLSKLLFGVTASDARVLSATVAVLFGVALLAVTRPAWRAARVNPLIALRYE